MIIAKDTIWHKGEEIILSGDVQIASGATLTIEAGAHVSGGSITVFGSLNVVGTRSDKVQFDDVGFLFGSDSSTDAHMEINNAKFDGGTFLYPTGNGSYGSFDVSNSVFKGVSGFYIWYPSAESSFVGNKFIQSQGISLGTSHSVRIENNSFLDPFRPFNGTVDSAFLPWNSGGGVVLRGNTFSIPDGSFAIEVPKSYGNTQVDARGNYFGTTENRVIATLILDGSDDLNRSSIVRFREALARPDSDAPLISLFIHGSAKDDNLYGWRSDDVLLGRAGDDLIGGGLGRDTLFGGAGRDSFVFTSAPGARNADTVTDFNPRADTVRLEGGVFTRIGNGAVSEAEFHASKTGDAHDRSDRLLYETDTGRLYYDRDGTGAADKVLFAVLDPGLRVTSADFLVF